ncbi:ribose uptake protein RbsU [Apilactobacillus micheneri]|uniref:Ribose uptake protein RbsU n=1 Tax=Apilactobacillus micheneri TaxID=1899430 RepID=A0A9Q8IPI6_9LACO|nr:ribose uptake protein RbsU [Apilactobacillus micheneri]TPR42637.1 ribose uptake protein RbsU [Apilactobacillus micheneri]TPR45605.1 ribose uptake protein RbsU [Apilactobacillus micheneri]TPR46164.1 ribose uptake protein RbsU [Apilactobacillus micheneri]TPR46849.1 ribose uptake protein RbsU [Apilactobacillus micheneri]
MILECLRVNILIGLIPALLWGIQPIILLKARGSTINQLCGTVYGAFIVSLIVYLIYRPEIAMRPFILCLISGMCWTFGQMTQYQAFKSMGIALGTPLSTAMQLIGNPITAVIFFQEWPTAMDKYKGFFALLVIIIGIILITKNGKQDAPGSNYRYKYGFWILFIGTFGYIGYSAFPRLANVSGSDAIFPQAIGMVIAAIIFSFFITEYRVQKPLFSKFSFENMILGLIFGIAAFAYLVSIKLNGVATGFTLTQMDVVVATLGGMILFHEVKGKRKIFFTILGLLIIILGGILIQTI